MKLPKSLNILLADDDRDDRFFFEKALKSLPMPARLTTVEDGENLMEYLRKNSKKLPEALFLDLNMPRKNGFECILDIKSDPKLKHLPIIIYSTSLHEDVTDLLYKNGAYCYVRKCDLSELKEILHHVLTLMTEKKFFPASRDKFVMNHVMV